jgi:hypothetical protein
MGTQRADHVTTLYPQKMALTLPTTGVHSASTVRLQTKSHGVSFVFDLAQFYMEQTTKNRIKISTKPQRMNAINYKSSFVTFMALTIIMK